MRRSSSSLPLVALLLLGLPGCSSSGESLGPTPGAPDDGIYDDEAPSEGDGGDSSGDSDSAGEETGEDPSGPASDPVPDDDGHAVPDEQSGVCDLESDVSRWLAPNDSNAMTSPVLVREAALGELGTMQSISVRAFEFFNYYDFGYPAAEPGSLAIHAALAEPEDAAAGELLLQVGVSSEALGPEARAPLNVTLVLDTSGSMEGDAMEMLQQTSYAIASSLQAGDVVSIVTWSTEDAVVLGGHAVTGPDDPALLAKIDGLSARGVSDLHAGLLAGYALAQQSFSVDRINRVVLVSDGGTNAATADLDLIAQHGGVGNQEGIVLVGVGVGDAAIYRGDLIDAVTDAGKGAAVFVSSSEDAWSTFHDRFVSTMAVAARNVQVRLDMPAGFELVGQGPEATGLEIDDIIEPQHLAPSDAMVVHQRIRTCAPTELSPDATITVTVIWIDAVTFKPRQVQRVLTLGELFAADPAPLRKGVAVLAYAEGIKAYKQADPAGRTQTMLGAFEALAHAEAALPGDPQLGEIRQVLEALTE